MFVSDVYENSYHSHRIHGDSDFTTDVDATTSESRQLVSTNVFDNLPRLAKPKPKAHHNELDEYLATDIIDDVDDVLQWWADNSVRYPRLSRMATDYLCIPGLFYFISKLSIGT